MKFPDIFFRNGIVLHPKLNQSNNEDILIELPVIDLDQQPEILEFLNRRSLIEAQHNRKPGEENLLDLSSDLINSFEEIHQGLSVIGLYLFRCGGKYYPPERYITTCIPILENNEQFYVEHVETPFASMEIPRFWVRYEPSIKDPENLRNLRGKWIPVFKGFDHITSLEAVYSRRMLNLIHKEQFYRYAEKHASRYGEEYQLIECKMHAHRSDGFLLISSLQFQIPGNDEITLAPMSQWSLKQAGHLGLPDLPDDRKNDSSLVAEMKETGTLYVDSELGYPFYTEKPKDTEKKGQDGGVEKNQTDRREQKSRNIIKLARGTLRKKGDGAGKLTKKQAEKLVEYYGGNKSAAARESGYSRVYIHNALRGKNKTPKAAS